MLHFYLVYSRNDDHFYKKNMYTPECWQLSFFFLISEFRLSLPLWGLHMYSCQNTCILKILFSRNGRKIILSVLKYSFGMLTFPKARGICQALEKPRILLDILLGVLEGAQFPSLQHRWEREGFPMIVTKCVHWALGDGPGISSINVSFTLVPGFLKTIFLKIKCFSIILKKNRLRKQKEAQRLGTEALGQPVLLFPF